MKIQLTSKEIKNTLAIMDKVESGASMEFKKAIKDTKAIKWSLSASSGTVDIEINEEYMSDFLTVYEKYIRLLVPQIKTLYETVKLFKEETESVVHKYI